MLGRSTAPTTKMTWAMGPQTAPRAPAPTTALVVTMAPSRRGHPAAQRVSSNVAPQPALEDRGQAVGVALQVVFHHHLAAPRLAQALAQSGVVHQAADCFRQGLIVRRLHQQAIDAVPYELGDAGDQGGHAGYLHGHGLHQHHRDSQKNLETPHYPVQRGCPDCGP